ncbi:MAG TPA: single-stranded DNA-binding protein [Solirubrobacteraceae bacterium]|nr:single-stranded DNA-binding protein [Solirubrobacteraceae bacterium]
MNRIYITGWLTRDPEFFRLEADEPVCRMRVAAPREQRRLEQDPGAVHIDVVAGDDLAEDCAESLRQLVWVAIEGRLEHRRWSVADWESTSVYEVVVERLRPLCPTSGRTSGISQWPEPDPFSNVIQLPAVSTARRSGALPGQASATAHLAAPAALRHDAERAASDREQCGAIVTTEAPADRPALVCHVVELRCRALGFPQGSITVHAADVDEATAIAAEIHPGCDAVHVYEGAA